MAGNTFGKNFKITTWGESHGPAIGVVIDGCPAGLPLSEEDIQPMMDRRHPDPDPVRDPFADMIDFEALGTEPPEAPETKEHRKEPDKVRILSGVFEGKTTGTPISIMIENTDVKSSDYDELRDVYRPGHADYTFDKKYGIRDHRGGGRSSGRETAARVAAGAVAVKILKQLGIEITSEVTFLGLPPENDSAGGTVECVVTGMPAGVGETVFDKLDARLGAAIMSIGGVKAFEVGAGVMASQLTGSINNDEFIVLDGKVTKNTNYAGGILGGMSDGDEIVIKAYFKPTPSISKPQRTVNKDGEEVRITIGGRHDTYIALKGQVVVEAMTAVTLVDMLFENMHSQMSKIEDFYR